MPSVRAEDFRMVVDISLTLSWGCGLLKITERMRETTIVIVNHINY